MTVSTILPPRFPMPRNLSNQDGAKTIAAEIKRYWAKRGHAVEVRLVGAYSEGIDGRGVYGVRSNLVNGLPPGEVA